jgi:hypothetical protein
MVFYAISISSMYFSTIYELRISWYKPQVRESQYEPQLRTADE